MGIYTYSAEEIKNIEEACKITAKVLDEIEEYVEAGISTFELDKLAYNVIINSNSRPAFLGYRGYPASICASVNEVVVHGIPDQKTILKKGDIIGIDVGVFYKGYYGDSARTYKVGEISKANQQLLDVTRKALYSGIEQCFEGNRISDISNAVETHVVKYGFSPVRDYVGHGIGANLHEEPSIPNFGEKGNGPRIKEGMVLAVEPMINAGTWQVTLLNDGWTVVTKDNKPSAHFEHTVAVINGKARILTGGRNFN